MLSNFFMINLSFHVSHLPISTTFQYKPIQSNFTVNEYNTYKNVLQYSTSTNSVKYVIPRVRKSTLFATFHLDTLKLVWRCDLMLVKYYSLTRPRSDNQNKQKGHFYADVVLFHYFFREGCELMSRLTIFNVSIVHMSHVCVLNSQSKR